MDASVRFTAFVGRKAILYVALVLAITFYAAGASGDLKALWNGTKALNEKQADRLKTLIKDADGLRQSANNQLRLDGKNLRNAIRKDGDKAIQSELQNARQEKKSLTAKAPTQWKRDFEKYTLDLDALANEQKRQFRLYYLERKIKALETTKNLSKNYRASFKELGETNSKLQYAIKDCAIKQKNLRAYNKQNLLYRAYDQNLFIRKADELEAARNVACTTNLKNARQTFSKAKSALSATTKAWNAAQIWYLDTAPKIVHDFSNRLNTENARAQNNLKSKFDALFQKYQVQSIFTDAFFALLIISISPYLIRLLYYFVLAPMAMKRGAIKLQVPGGAGKQIVPIPASRTSVPVTLGPGEELLIRQDYLQTSSHTGSKGTQFFLDWKKPLTSFATGLSFLTRIRGDSEVTTVSAVRDGLAEVAILTLPDGASCVLQPRALAAVAQPIGRPLQITSHWRLGVLNAWLTLQLRYLVFHGPARLVIKGGRGVRVERADRGRIFGQDQLVGFSADLSYSVTRTETFWPYFIGREALLKDRILEGEGILIIEEAPLSARQGQVRRGLEGMMDAGMKVFGM